MLPFWSALRKREKTLVTHRDAALGQQQIQMIPCADGWREVARVCFLISWHVFGRCVCEAE